MAVLDAEELVARLRRDVERSVLRTRNGLRLMTGVGKPVTGASPRDDVWSAEKVRLYRYRSDQRRWNTPLLFVHSLVSKTYVFDLAPGNSFVETMLQRGHDVYLLDWGTPDELEAGNTLETYSDDYIPAAVREVLRTSAADDVNVFGYCFGGILSLLYAAGHTDDPLRSLSVMATPIDFTHMGSLTSVLRDGHVDAEDLLDSTGNVPAEVIAQGFRMIDPMSAVTEYVDLWQHMWNDDYLNSYRTVMAWAKDQIPFPGTAFVQMQNELVRAQRPGDRPRSVARWRGRLRRHPRAVQQHHRREGHDRAPGSDDSAHADRRRRRRHRDPAAGWSRGAGRRPHRAAPPHPGDGVVDRVADGDTVSRHTEIVAFETADEASRPCVLRIARRHRPHVHPRRRAGAGRARRVDPTRPATSRDRRYVATKGDDIVGYLAVLPENDHSAHVAAIRIVVHPAHRRQGIASDLARHAVVSAARDGIKKLVVEVVADQDGDRRHVHRARFRGRGRCSATTCSAMPASPTTSSCSRTSSTSCTRR